MEIIIAMQLFLLKIIIKVTFTTFCFIIGATAITNGKIVQGDKRYMVYLLKSPTDKQPHFKWMCGGAIINPMHILTSATCIYDVNNVYVISGYRRYMSVELMDDDRCMQKKKKRVVYICTHKNFSMLFKWDDYWNYGDIAVARVDSAFEYYDMSYYWYCSYPPAPIRVNVNQRFVNEGRDVLAYGWGSLGFYRAHPDPEHHDLNSKFLRYSASKLSDNKICYENYFSDKLSKYHRHFKKYIICVVEKSTMDENGKIVEEKILNDDCNRRNFNSSANLERCSQVNKHTLRRRLEKEELLETGGFCQNDHGGPLVTYIGGRETVIGVITTSLVNHDMQCQAPYLYTNTRCVGKLIYCVLYPERFRRKLNCDGTPEERGIREMNITWPDDET